MATGRIPRLLRIMALAIRFEGLIRDGVVKDQADLARLGYVSRARLTQIMDLLCLAPDVQEAVLFLPNVGPGEKQIVERQLRMIAALPNWSNQERFWACDRINREP